MMRVHCGIAHHVVMQEISNATNNSQSNAPSLPLDASYTISFARIRVGDITATVVVGDSEYTISARGRAGGVVKLLVDGEGSFTTRGTIKAGHPVPTNFKSTKLDD